MHCTFYTGKSTDEKARTDMIDEKLRRRMGLAFEQQDYAEALELSKEFDKQILRYMKVHMKVHLKEGNKDEMCFSASDIGRV